MVLFASVGCAKLPELALNKPVPTDPRDTIQSYFSLLSARRTADARRLLTPTFLGRLGPDAVDALLRSVNSATVTDVTDAVAWANQLGAKIPNPPSDRREFLVTVRVDPAADANEWSAGTNRRFIDLVKTNGVWQIDNMAIMPGPLVTGQVTGVVSNGPSTFVIPVAALRLGPAPIDPVIFAARQRAADRGEASWAIDPVEVTRRDGPSFGIDPRDSLALDGADRDPVSLNSRAVVRVYRTPEPLLVTLEQPIRSGQGGVWAIQSVRVAPRDGVG